MSTKTQKKHVKNIEFFRQPRKKVPRNYIKSAQKLVPRNCKNQATRENKFPRKLIPRKIIPRKFIPLRYAIVFFLVMVHQGFYQIMLCSSILFGNYFKPRDPSIAYLTVNQIFHTCLRKFLKLSYFFIFLAKFCLLISPKFSAILANFCDTIYPSIQR